MNIFYKIENNKFCGFYVFEEKPKENNYYEISSEERDNLIQEQFLGKEIVYRNGKLISYQKPQVPNEFIKPEFDYETETWIDVATDLEKVQAQISEYSELDTPSTLKEMGTELANECMNMLIELRNMAYTLGNLATIEDRDLPIFSKPSAKLKAFKDKFNSIR